VIVSITLEKIVRLDCLRISSDPWVGPFQFREDATLTELRRSSVSWFGEREALHKKSNPPNGCWWMLQILSTTTHAYESSQIPPTGVGGIWTFFAGHSEAVATLSELRINVMDS
jgi:hypothetical protein